MYNLHANASVTTSKTVDQFVSIIDHLEPFRLSTVALPPVGRYEH